MYGNSIHIYNKIELIVGVVSISELNEMCWVI